jgi:iron complex transport system permease protein
MNMLMRTTWLALGLVAGLAGGMLSAGAVDIRDAQGRNVSVKDASRIVSIGGSVTEILYALGQGDRVVAVDISSMYPPEALKTKPNVGYFRQLSPEGVIGLAPSLILATDGAGPKEAVSVLEAAAIPFVRVPDTYDGEGVVEKIRMIAKAVGAESRGACLERVLNEDLSTLKSLREKIRTPARVMFLFSFMNGRPMVAGRNTAAEGIIKLAGGKNAFEDFEGYKQVNDEAIIAAAPDLVLSMKRSPAHDLDAAAVFTHPAFAQTPAAASKRFFAMDGVYMLGFGPRVARAARDLSFELYPSLKTAARNAGPGRPDLRKMNGAETLPRRIGFSGGRSAPWLVFSCLSLVLLAAIVLSISVGAAGIPPRRLFAALTGINGDPATLARDQLIIWSIRLPRIAAAIIIGAMLASAGAVMQGLFRNPLADPSLVGVSSGAGLAAALTIVIGDKFMVAQIASVPFEVLPVVAFAGALITTAALYRLATYDSRTSIAIFLLGGVAIAALTNAGIGLLVFIADDRQLRDVTFWLLGSLGGANWPKVMAIAPFLLASIAFIPFLARGLDLLVLGEAEAFHAGVAVQRLKVLAIVMVAAATGAAVSVSGIIGFVGIVVPHLLRLLIGPAHGRLLPASMVLGAALLLLADTAARILAAPAEVPIGIITAVIGAPFFLALLLRHRSAATL